MSPSADRRGALFLGTPTLPAVVGLGCPSFRPQGFVAAVYGSERNVGIGKSAARGGGGQGLIGRVAHKWEPSAVLRVPHFEATRRRPALVSARPQLERPRPRA